MNELEKKEIERIKRSLNPKTKEEGFIKLKKMDLKLEQE